MVEMTKRATTGKTIACALGVLLAVMMMPAAVARADQMDQDFNNFVQAHGVQVTGNASQTVSMARVMCQDLNAGYTQKDEVYQLTGSQRLNRAQAEMFVGAATADYCPGKHNGTRPTKK